MALGNLYLVSAPSGTGKTSLMKELSNRLNNLYISISYTTREKRSSESERKSYHYISKKEFNTLIANNFFIEYAEIYSNYYGTDYRSINTKLHSGIDVILEIDWQGASQVKQKHTDSKLIFIAPPNLETLEERLTLRNQDTDDVIQNRLQKAHDELLTYKHYDYLIINDDFENAVDELCAIITANRLLLNYRQINNQFNKLNFFNVK
jgi:guanylate kinase